MCLCFVSPFVLSAPHVNNQIGAFVFQLPLLFSEHFSDTPYTFRYTFQIHHILSDTLFRYTIHFQIHFSDTPYTFRYTFEIHHTFRHTFQIHHTLSDTQEFDRNIDLVSGRVSVWCLLLHVYVTRLCPMLLLLLLVV